MLSSRFNHFLFIVLMMLGSFAVRAPHCGCEDAEDIRMAIAIVGCQNVLSIAI